MSLSLFSENNPLYCAFEDPILENIEILWGDILSGIIVAGCLLCPWLASQDWRRLDRKLLVFLRKKPFTYFSPYPEKRNHCKPWDF